MRTDHCIICGLDREIDGGRTCDGCGGFICEECADATEKFLGEILCNDCKDGAEDEVEDEEDVKPGRKRNDDEEDDDEEKTKDSDEEDDEEES